MITKTGGDCIALNSSGASPLVGGTTVTGNVISNCGQGGSAKGAGVNRMGIELERQRNSFTSITGNSIYDDQRSPTTLYGIINTDQTAVQSVGAKPHRRDSHSKYWRHIRTCDFFRFELRRYRVSRRHGEL